MGPYGGNEVKTFHSPTWGEKSLLGLKGGSILFGLSVLTPTVARHSWATPCMSTQPTLQTLSWYLSLDRT